MTDLAQPNFAPQDLDELQGLRALTFAFERMIANLDANEQNDNYNEQFNKIRAETKAIVNKYGYTVNAPQAVSGSLLAERGQKVSTRLSGIVIFGVILALLGLGINSIILEDVIINSLGCLISTGGMLLVIGAFAVWAVTSARRSLTNLGDLYLRCEILLQELDQLLTMGLPGYAAPPALETPNIPTAASLTFDSLEKQSADWRQKLATLNQQRRMLGQHAPVELTTTVNYVQRELDRLEYELVNLRERVELPLSPEPEPFSPPVEPSARPFDPSSNAVRVAHAFTQEMPAVKPEPPANPEAVAESEPEVEADMPEATEATVEPEPEEDTQQPQ